MTANIVYTTGSEWDWGKIFGLTSGDDNANNGAGVYFLKSDQSPHDYHLIMKDAAGNTKSYVSTGNDAWKWQFFNGPMKLTWSTNQVTWQECDSAGVWTTLFDSKTMAPVEGGSWNIPTADAHILANTWVNGFQLIFDSMELQLLPTTEAVPVAVTNLFVSGWNDGVRQFDTYGSEIGEVDAGGMTTQMVFGTDGLLYVMHCGNGGGSSSYVDAVDPFTCTSLGTMINASQNYAYGLAAGPDGDFYMGVQGVNLNYGYREISRYAGPLKENAFAQETPYVTPNSTADPNDTIYPLRQPYYIKFGPDGDLYEDDGPDNNGWGAILRWNGSTDLGSYVSGVGYVEPVFGPDNNLYMGLNCYQGPSGGSPGALIGQFINLAGSPISRVNFIAFDPVVGDLFASDGQTVCRFVGPGKTDAGSFICVHASLSEAGMTNGGPMVFAPVPAATATSVHAAKTSACGTGVSISSAVVAGVLYNATGRYAFAIEDADRHDGIRVISSENVSAGDLVSIAGRIATSIVVNVPVGGGVTVPTVENLGEAVIDATNGTVTVVSANGTVPKPLGLSNKATGGGAYGLQEPSLTTPASRR